MNHHNPTPPHAADQPPHGANNAENTSANNGTNNNANTTGSAESASFAIPAPLKRLLTHLPAWPGSVLFVSALNLILAPQIPSDVAQALQALADGHQQAHAHDAAVTAYAQELLAVDFDQRLEAHIARIVPDHPHPGKGA